MIDVNEMAFTMARTLVMKLERHERTDPKLREIAEQAAELLVQSAGPVSVDGLLKRLQAEFDVWVPQPIVVSDPADHEVWLGERQAGITFSYWKRYRAFLDKSWKSSTVESLHEATDQVLSLMEDPQRVGHWKTYGMVYGQVQSGKTASYTGVICKAMDAGYRVIVVLTSQHESLRHQTQERLDREFLGFNTKFTRSSDADSSKDIGVGSLGLPKPEVKCQAITTRDKDFTAGQLKGTPVNIYDVPILVVAKKNARILTNLRDWLANFARQSDGSVGNIQNLPMLLIDDEADYASVDTKRIGRGSQRTQSDPEHDPTAINKAIRGLLELFEKRVYLAYTATPFANIFIPHDTDHPEYGEDLFPRSFMVALEPPSNYCGPEVVFGLEDPSAADIREPLPIIREVEDHEPWIPDSHRRGHPPGGRMPDSLVEAIDAFVLSTAVRRVRNRDHDVAGGHCTMLIHVTRFTDVQGTVARQVEEHLRDMVGAWGDHSMSGHELRERLKSLWDKDFEPTYASLAERDDVNSSVGPRVAWQNVEQMVPQVLEEATDGVRRINGTASDVLDYQSSTPVTVVAVGGDKLSRGLTLEGLSVSYYLRASRTYDTLLQMGRWFGYRPDYLDVTRLYTTGELVNYYVHITRANRELMDLTTAVARANQTPRHVGMRVLDGRDNLQVTAAAKMRSSAVMEVGFSAQRAETLVMRKDKPAMAANFSRLEQLVREVLPLEEVPEARLQGAGKGLFRRNVPAESVLDFLNGFDASPRVLSANPVTVAEYIRTQMEKGELIRWTVAVTGGASTRRLPIEGTELPLVKRRTLTGHSRIRDTECEVGVLVSPAHEAIGLPAGTVRRAFDLTAAEFRARGKGVEPKRASGESLRKLRDPAEGLLLVYPVDPVLSGVEVETPEVPIVGYAICFPHSDRASKIRYRVNQVYLEQLTGAVNDSDEEEDW